jgi:hypothetical protein
MPDNTMSIRKETKRGNQKKTDFYQPLQNIDLLQQVDEYARQYNVHKKGYEKTNNSQQHTTQKAKDIRTISTL